jgi:hypothetical protein
MYTYSFLDSYMTIAGPGGIFTLAGDGSGAAEEGASFAYMEDKDTLTIGADGSGMHSLRANNSGTCTVSLLKNSGVNALLSVMYNLQKTSSALWGQNILTLRSSTSLDVIILTNASFIRHADVGYATVGAVNQWRFNGVKLAILLGNGAL